MIFCDDIVKFFPQHLFISHRAESIERRVNWTQAKSKPQKKIKEKKDDTRTPRAISSEWSGALLWASTSWPIHELLQKKKILKIKIIFL